MIFARPRYRRYDLYTSDDQFIKSIPANELGPYTRLGLALGYTIIVEGND